MRGASRLALLAFLFVSTAFAAQPSSDEQAVWSLEKSYWKYVQANDLELYLALWSPDFLGWPLSYPEPSRKAQITDWITARTTKGETLKSYDLEPLKVQLTDNIATTTYRIRMTWVDKNGIGQPTSLRIIHTMRRNPSGVWQIISGMAAPTNADGH